MLKLAEELGSLFLLVNHVGHYIAETPGVTVAKYYESFSELQKTERSPLKQMGLNDR